MITANDGEQKRVSIVIPTINETSNINIPDFIDEISDIISFLVEHNIDTLKDIIRNGVLQKGITEKDDITDFQNDK